MLNLDAAVELATGCAGADVALTVSTKRQPVMQDRAAWKRASCA
jgi:hypothetical protein